MRIYALLCELELMKKKNGEIFERFHKENKHLNSEIENKINKITNLNAEIKRLSRISVINEQNFNEKMFFILI